MSSRTHTASESCAVQEGWVLHTVEDTSSTNALAATLSAWHAVRANTQSAGRGRTGRHWVSDRGGLWLSAVLPCPGARPRWAILPLAAGWAVMGALREFGVPDVRLRWPNDLMVGRRKLAGILVERYAADTAVIGIGLNVNNRPEVADESLAGETVRLGDLAPRPCTVEDAARVVLGALRRMHAILLDSGFREIADDLNLGWSEPRRVSIRLERGDTFDGVFEGIDATGRLRLVTKRDGARYYSATDVALLRELED